MRRIIALSLLLCMSLCFISSCSVQYAFEGEGFTLGFSEQMLEYESMDKYYIAGYKNGRHPQGVLDAQYVKAVWIDNGNAGILIISVDCIALDSGTVKEIRNALKDLSKESGCNSINVVSTHTHAGVDTLGLWGPVGINGRNEEFNKQIVSVAATTAENAYKQRSRGELIYSEIKTENMQKDSREPQVYDSNLYQIRFVPQDTAKQGVRIVSYAAHAESLRGDNLMISADFPGELARRVKQACGDSLMFLPSAVGGLIMTPEFSKNAVENMQLTAERLAEYLLSASEASVLEDRISLSRVEFKTRLENTLFMYYKFLGILGNEVSRGIDGNYYISTELTVMGLGDVFFAFLPGEIFPELVINEGGLNSVAGKYGINKLLTVGLANDEIGYIIPSNDFVLNETAPYVTEAEGHYEETNSVGRDCAADLAKAFEKALSRLK